MIWAKLYEEHISEKQLVSTLSENPNIKYWAYILHDKDVFPSGELKKAHFHVIIDYIDEDRKGGKYFMYKTFTETMLSGADIQNARSPKSIHRYLLHLDNLEKYQYAPEAIKTSDPNTVEEFLVETIKIGKRETYAIKISTFVEEMLNSTGVLASERDILKFCKSNGCYDYYICHQDWINHALNVEFGIGLPEYRKRTINSI